MTEKDYVVDSVYRSNARLDQAPVLMSYVAATAGFVPPDPGDRFTYLDLGCSAGETLNLLAAAHPDARFEGVDINTTAIDKARRDAESAGLTNVSYRSGAFSALKPREMTGYDYIVCQGTYSWLSQAEREALFEVVDQRLNPGGLFLLHYVPFGNASVTTMWRVLRHLVPANGLSSADRMDAGVELLGALRDHGAMYFRNHPQALAILNDVEAYDPASPEFGNMAHNALAENYATAFFGDVAHALGASGLTYCGDTELRINDPDQSIPRAIRNRFDALESRVQQEILKDFCLPRTGRGDIYVRSQEQQHDAARQFLHNKLGAILLEPADAVWASIRQRSAESLHDFDRPSVRSVFEQLARGANDLETILREASGASDELEDAFHKLLSSPKIGVCINARLQDFPDEAGGWSPASQLNSLALAATARQSNSVLLAAPALGSWVSLAWVGGLLAQDICAHGSGGSDEAAYRRLLKIAVAVLQDGSGQLPGQLAEQASFVTFRRWFMRERLPLLTQIGALQTKAG